MGLCYCRGIGVSVVQGCELARKSDSPGSQVGGREFGCKIVLMDEWFVDAKRFCV